MHVHLRIRRPAHDLRAESGATRHPSTPTVPFAPPVSYHPSVQSESRAFRPVLHLDSVLDQGLDAKLSVEPEGSSIPMMGSAVRTYGLREEGLKGGGTQAEAGCGGAGGLLFTGETLRQASGLAWAAVRPGQEKGRRARMCVGEGCPCGWEG